MRRLALAALAGCTGNVGTIAIEVKTAPGSAVMDDVTRVRMVLSTPYTMVLVDREPDGSFLLELDVVAEGPSGYVLFEGFDADGDIVAYGRTPLLPIAAVDAAIAIYVAEPMSLAEAPVTLGEGRSELGAGLLDYGVLLAGGRAAAGAPTRDLVVYSAYDHELQEGLELPSARASITVGTGITGYAYLFGGEDSGGDPTATLWRFDTTVAPSGAWLTLDEADPDFARTAAPIGPLGSDAFLIGGEPPLLLEGLLLRMTPFTSPPGLDGGIASVLLEELPDAPVVTLVAGLGAGTTGIMRLADGDFDEEDAPGDARRTRHAVVPILEDKIVVVGGEDESGLLTTGIDCTPGTRSYQPVPNILATPRVDAAVASTSCCVVVAGGLDAAGEVLGDAEILDARTLEPLDVLPLLVPRTGAIARPLPNQQVLIVGGVDADGAPVETIELFTPFAPTDL